MEAIAEELVRQLPDDWSRNIFIINKYRIEHNLPRWKKYMHLEKIRLCVEEYKTLKRVSKERDAEA